MKIFKFIGATGYEIALCLGDYDKLYVSDRFVARVKAAKLKGLEFNEVWSSEG